jgi:phage protein D
MGLGVYIAVNDQPNSELTEQVSSIEVYEKMDHPTTYKIRFMVDICDDDIAQALEEYTYPGSMLSILVEQKDKRINLVKGPVVNQQAHLQHGGAGSWLDVEGTDTSLEMDLQPPGGTKEWTDFTDGDIVRTILENYNLARDVKDTPDSAHKEDDHSLIQKKSDLGQIRELGERNGFHFWITYDAEGNKTGHFRPRQLTGNIATTLVVNLENNNIENLRVAWDIRRPSVSESRQINLRNKEEIKGRVSLADEETLGGKNLIEVANFFTDILFLTMPADDAGTLMARNRAVIREAQWFITATCRTSMDRLCHLLRAHTLVEVQGAGKRHSGKYYVTGVKHTINALAHTMEVELARNAWGNEKRSDIA